MTSSRILDLGCGDKKVAGAIGIDKRKLVGVDIVHDIEEHPWPLDESSFDRVVMSHILEHLGDPAAALAEVHRVCVPGAEIEIVTPHFSSVNSWEDPSHKHHFALGSFEMMIHGTDHNSEKALFSIIEKRLTFCGGIRPNIGRMIAFFSLKAYEQRNAFTYPARNIIVRLRVEKER